MKNYPNSLLILILLLFFFFNKYSNFKLENNLKPCKKGFTKVGKNCFGPCPLGMETSAAVCMKRQYSRGYGYPLWGMKNCENKHTRGCERCGLYIFAKCKANYINLSCLMCYENCPKGLKPIGKKVCLRPLQK